MKLLVLNGSPKGDVSVTMQYVKFIRKQFPEHEYQVLNILSLRKTSLVMRLLTRCLSGYLPT